MLSQTSTEWAPWHVIPADRKWFERLAVGVVIAHALMEIDPHFPKVSHEQREALLEIRQSLEAKAPEGAAPDPLTQSQQDGQTQDGQTQDGQTQDGAAPVDAPA